MKNKIEQGNILKQDVEELVFDIFQTRTKFNFDFNNKLYCYAGNLYWMIRCCKNKRLKKTKREMKFFSQAEGKFMDDLDILKILEFWNIGNLEFWIFRILEWWNRGILNLGIWNL